jgi:hypothetical protein
LVELEVLVPHTLTIYANALERQNAVFFTEPTAVELVVWDSPEENDANGGCD